MNRRERRAAGRKPQTVSRAADANTPVTLYAAGLGHMRAERYLDAQMCCEQALALDPDHADTLHLTGLLSLHANNTISPWSGSLAPSGRIPSRIYLRASGLR